MHSVARDSIRLGLIEQDIVGKMEGVALAEGWGVSFPTILTQHGETLHNHIHDKVIEPGKLMVIDAGVESNEHYASDFTRTYPTSGKFTPKQREVYQIVCDCNERMFDTNNMPILCQFVPSRLRATAYGFMNTVGVAMGAVCTQVLGRMQDGGHLGAAFAVLGVVTALALLVELTVLKPVTDDMA